MLLALEKSERPMPVSFLHAEAPKRLLMKGWVNSDKKGDGIDFVLMNYAYLRAASAEGAKQLRLKIQKDLDAGCFVSINFCVRGGWIAAHAYIKEFAKEIKQGVMQWGCMHLTTRTSMHASKNILIDKTGMATKGEVIVQIDELADTCLTQYMVLKLLRDEQCDNKKLIFQCLLEKKPKEKVMDWNGQKLTIPLAGMTVKEKMHCFNEVLNNGDADPQLKGMIHRLDYSTVVPEDCSEQWIVMPFEGNMPGMWRDLHDCLDEKHANKKLIIVPAIVFCNADSVCEGVDFDLALHHSNRSDLYASSEATKHYSPIIYVTIFVYRNQNGDVVDVSDFVHVKHKRLLSDHRESAVIVLPDDVLQNKNIIKVLEDRLGVPVNSRSAQGLQKKHPHLQVKYDIASAVPVRDVITIKADNQ